MVFDDLSFFSSPYFARYATTPFGLELRLLPHFTLALPQVLWGYFPPWNHAHIHRMFSLVLHISCVLVLFRLLCELLAAVNRPVNGRLPQGSADLVLPAFVGAVFFAIHPVAVYGVAYLVQRTIIVATLFALLSLFFFVHGLVQRKHSYIIPAIAFYTLSIFSKEHSLLLPVASALALLLFKFDRQFTPRYLAAYLLGCLPAAVTVVLLARSLIGRAYEPGMELLLAQIEGIPQMNIAGGPWLVSAITQAGLFFKYLVAWLVPDTGTMAIDVRIDFAGTWTPVWIAVKVLGYAAFGALGFFLLSKGGTAALAGFGMLFFWAMFALEFSAVRFQEPFVLYRSYLWAPGIIVAVVAVLGSLSRRAVLFLFLAATPILVYQAHDRLNTFSSALALWEDAASKLPPKPVPWGSRTLFGLAGEQVFAGQWDEAMQTADRCIAQYPRTSYCYFSRGAVHLYREEYDEALAYLDRSLALYAKSGVAHHHRGFAMEKLGRVDEAKSAYRRAYELGFMGGLYRLNMLEEPGTGPRTIYDIHRPELDRR